MVCGNECLVWLARHDNGYQTRMHVAARSSTAFYYDIIQDTIPFFFILICRSAIARRVPTCIQMCVRLGVLPRTAESEHGFDLLLSFG
jgi:hypothetical protein